MGMDKILRKIKKIDKKNQKRVKDAVDKINKNLKDPIFERISREDGRDIVEKAFGVRLTKPAKYVLVGGLVSALAYDATKEQVHKGQLGNITPSRMANMVGQSVSPGLDKIAKQLEETTNPYFQEQIAKKSVSHTQSGVSPEIVFAMHELRSGN